MIIFYRTSDKLTKINTKASPLIVLVGVSGSNIVFDCNEQEKSSVEGTLLVTVTKSGEVVGVETIGAGITRSVVKSAVEKVSAQATHIFSDVFTIST